MSNEWQMHVLRDEMWAIRIRLGSNDYFVEFQLYELQGIYTDDGEPRFENGHKDIGASPWEFEGSVKWDGCMNFMSNPKYMLHVCGPTSPQRMFAVLKRVYELAEPMMPNAVFSESK